MKRIVLFAILFAVAGCGQQQASSSTSVPPTAPSADQTPRPPPKPTPEAWRAAFDASYHMIGKSEDAGDGVTSFSACFDSVVPAQMNKCSVGANVEKDSFRELWIFTPRLSSLLISPIGVAHQSFVASYVSVRENKAPRILLSPHFMGSDWLFMSRLAIMVDGNIVLEQTFSQPGEVTTHIGSGYVEESSNFILSDQQVAGLRKIHKGSKVILRITGKNGYVSIDSGKRNMLFNADAFASDIKEALAIYDGISVQTHGKEITDQL